MESIKDPNVGLFELTNIICDLDSNEWVHFQSVRTVKTYNNNLYFSFYVLLFLFVFYCIIFSLYFIIFIYVLLYCILRIYNLRIITVKFELTTLR